ncbi:MAG: SGNH/GDSL hydrolase family protein [Polyangiales bacterium]
MSLAATVGWSAWAALSGTPPPLDRELDAARPTHATVMFGTNDIQSRNLDRYGDNLLTIVDRLLARGVIPHLTAVPPRDDDPAADAWVDRYNAVSRAVAQSRGVPFIDLHRELVGLPSHGVGADGIHLNVYTAGGAARGCVFSAAGLRYGHNVRNLLTIQSLDRALAVTARGGAAPDPSAPRMQGDGSLAAPIEVPSLPFVDVRDTSRGGFSRVDRYPGCASSADESGPEFLYRLALTRATTVRAVVVSRPGVDVDIHALTGAATGAACVARDDRSVRVNLGPGTHYFSLDTYVSAGRPRVGEFIVALLAE